jgi:hypothetical protein
MPFDTSGKSGALFYYSEILQTPTAVAGASGAIAAKHPHPPLKLQG